MARYKLTIVGDRLQRKIIDRLVQSLEEVRKGEITVTVAEDKIPTSRQQRFDAIQSAISDAASGIEELKDELQEWFDNLPENLQSGDKADSLQTAIDELDSMHNNLEEAAGASVEFPGMY